MVRHTEEQIESSAISSTQDRLQSQKDAAKRAAADENTSSGNLAERNISDESGSDGADASNGRPMSPGTLALMCDEQDTNFMFASSPREVSHGNNTSSKLPPGQGRTEVYAEQERMVLTKLRDCLNKLITLGKMKETKCSSLARTGSGSLQDPISNGTMNTRTETKSKHDSIDDGIAKTFVSAASKIPQNACFTDSYFQ